MHQCNTCGFAGFREFLTTRPEPAPFFLSVQDRGEQGTPEKAECLRGIHDLRDEIAQIVVVTSNSKSGNVAATRSVLRKQRRCRYYFPFQPGATLEAHLQMQQDGKGRSAMLQSALVGGVLAGVFTTMGSIAAILLTR